MSESEHFVASLRVEKIKRIEPPSQSNQSYKSDSVQPSKRLKSEVTHITIKAPDIDTLQHKLKAHIDLIEDDVEPDEFDIR